jgi:hypothetical protein
MAVDALENLRRSSGISVDREGRVLHQGELMTHSGVHRTFAAGLDVDARGEAIVHVGPQWAYVQCDRTPFVVVRARRGDGVLHLTLNTGAAITLEAPDIHLQLVGDSDLYVRIHDGRHEARFGRVAWSALAESLQAVAGGLFLPLGHVTVAVHGASPLES